MPIWRDTRLTEPGFYLYREGPKAPQEVVHAFAVNMNMTEPRYGWADPPPGSATRVVLGKRMHDPGALEVSGIIGEFLCDDTGAPLRLGEAQGRKADEEASYRDELLEAAAVLGTDAEHGLIDVLQALETAARNRGWTPSEGALWDWLRVVLAEPKAVKWPDPAPPEPKGEKAKGK